MKGSCLQAVARLTTLISKVKSRCCTKRLQKHSRSWTSVAWDDSRKSPGRNATSGRTWKADWHRVTLGLVDRPTDQKKRGAGQRGSEDARNQTDCRILWIEQRHRGCFHAECNPSRSRDGEAKPEACIWRSAKAKVLIRWLMAGVC